MFGFSINSEVIDVLKDETYIDMTVAQYTFINGGNYIFKIYVYIIVKNGKFKINLSR